MLVCHTTCVYLCSCAADGSDYTGLSTTLTLEPGAERASIDIHTLDDSFVEDNETFTVEMVTSDPTVLLSNINRTVLIIDNDGQWIEHNVTYMHMQDHIQNTVIIYILCILCCLNS